VVIQGLVRAALLQGLFPAGSWPWFMPLKK
jgi:hypothetical protein